jgi:hypothetical protein
MGCPQSIQSALVWAPGLGQDRHSRGGRGAGQKGGERPTPPRPPLCGSVALSARPRQSGTGGGAAPAAESALVDAFQPAW